MLRMGTLHYGGNDMMAYLTMRSSRLVELRRVLKPTWSLSKKDEREQHEQSEA